MLAILVDDQKVGPPESTAQNLTNFVNDIQGLGGNPILLTPLSRRSFRDDETIADQLAPWGEGESGSHRSRRLASAERLMSSNPISTG